MHGTQIGKSGGRDDLAGRAVDGKTTLQDRKRTVKQYRGVHE